MDWPEKDLPENFVKLISSLAWPTIVLFASIVFYQPLSKLIQRISKFSAFKVDVELEPLSQARSLSATVEGLKKVAVTESQLAQIVAGVIKSGSADYVLVNFGKDDDEEWITSRLFLLSAILERSRVVRCLVFLGEKQKFLGAATPRDVRASLGAHFLAYESAFAGAYGNLAQADQNIFRGGLSEALVNNLTNGFLRNPLISTQGQPASVLGWIKLERDPSWLTTWEYANWVTAASLREILGLHLLTGSVVANPGPITPEVTKSVVAATGMFVALTSKDNSFLELCDRYAVLENVAREALQQSLNG